MSESAAVMGDDATLSAVIASIVELVEPTVHPGDGSAHAFVEKDALDKVVRHQGGQCAALMPSATPATCTLCCEPLALCRPSRSRVLLCAHPPTHPPCPPPLQDDVVQQEYSAAYSRLIFAVPPSRFAFPAVEDLRQYAGQALLRVSSANPGLLPRALAESVVATTVQTYAAAAGGTIS